MTETNEVTMTGGVDERRPGWVAVAAIWIALSGAFSGAISAWGAISGGVTVEGLLLVGYALVLVTIAVGIFLLKKWAYWAFVAVVILAAMNIAADLLLVGLDIPPGARISIPQVIRLMVSIAWLVYFFTKPVRNAFEIAW